MGSVALVTFSAPRRPGCVKTWSTVVTPWNSGDVIAPRVVALGARRWCIVRAPETSPAAFSMFVEANHQAAKRVADAWLDFAIEMP